MSLFLLLTQAAQEADDLEKLLQEEPKNEIQDALAQVEKEQEEYGETEGVKAKIPRQLPPLPVSQYTPPPVTPKENPGDGVNKKVIYRSLLFCNCHKKQN